MSRAEVAGHTVSTEHYIDGARVGSPSTFEDRSPIDGALLAEVARGDAATADAAIAAIRQQNDPSYRESLMDVLQQREDRFTTRGFGQGL